MQSKKSAGDSGPALDWTRKNFNDRQQSMMETVLSSLPKQKNSENVEVGVIVRLKRTPVLFIAHAIPSSYSVSAGREKVGQPFLQDYTHLGAEISNTVWHGPVHIISCRNSITEAQGIKLLGFPDAMFVKSAFGIYLADPIQKIQMFLIANCMDETSTRHNVGRFMEWLEESRELELFLERAKSRRNIIQSIHSENTSEQAK